MPNRSRRPSHSRRGCRLVFGVVVVMPLVADCVPPGSVKSTVPPGLRLMLPRLRSSGFDVPAVSTMAEQPGLTARPLNCWLLVVLAFPWIARVPPPKAKEELSDSVVDDVGRRRTGLAEIELERAGGDGRAARVGVAAAEDQRSAAGLGQAARAADHAADRERVALVSKVAVVLALIAMLRFADRANEPPACKVLLAAKVMFRSEGDPGHGAQGGVARDRDDARVEHQSARERVVPGQSERPAAGLDQSAVAADRAAEGGVGVVAADREGNRAAACR